MGRLLSVYRSKLPPSGGEGPCHLLAWLCRNSWFGASAASLFVHDCLQKFFFALWHCNWSISIWFAQQSKWWFMNLSRFALILNWAILGHFVTWLSFASECRHWSWIEVEVGFSDFDNLPWRRYFAAEWSRDLGFLLAINYKEESIDRSNTAHARWRIELEVAMSRLFHRFTPFHFVMRQVASMVSLVLF